VIQIKIVLVTLALLFLVGCSVSRTQEIEQRVDATAGFVEGSLCSTQTFKNLEGAVINAIRVIPFFTDWESVCVPSES
jgi:Tfp pilus assembly protein PilP